MLYQGAVSQYSQAHQSGVPRGISPTTFSLSVGLILQTPWQAAFFFFSGALVFPVLIPILLTAVRLTEE